MHLSSDNIDDGKASPGSERRNNSSRYLFSVSMLVTIAALAVLGVAVAVGVVHRSALASENVGSDDDFEDPANVATTIADHEDQINGGGSEDIEK